MKKLIFTACVLVLTTSAFAQPTAAPVAPQEETTASVAPQQETNIQILEKEIANLLKKENSSTSNLQGEDIPKPTQTNKLPDFPQ